MTDFQTILEAEGETVTWYKRTVTGETISWSTENVKMIVQPVRAEEIILQSGYTLEDYVKVFTISAIKQKDKVLWESAQWEILPVQPIKLRGVIQYYKATCRRLLQ